MGNYKIIVQYDGTRYKGWQGQKSTPDTIQGKLETCLSRILEQDIEVNGSGRTDAGVHAIGQVANFHAELHGKTVEELLAEVNHYLPDDIAVVNMEEVDDRFHARFCAKDKTYRYRIHTSEISNVFERKYVYRYVDHPLDVEAMCHAAGHLIGEHDFKAFCGNSHIKKSTVRKIFNIRITESNDEVYIDYTGSGFLQNMVRILTGTLIEVGIGKRSPDSMHRLIHSKNREEAGFMAPPQGLCLMHVSYEEEQEEQEE